MKRSIVRIVLAVALLFTSSMLTVVDGSPATTRAQAISMVRSILKRKAVACRISKTVSVTASQAKTGWRVTATVVMAASGTPRTEALVWIVASGQAVPASQIASEVSSGCP